MHNLRTITKYPNRRLYDCVESRYITLADLRQLVLAQVEFQVIERKTQEDITNAVLLQVISEQERDGGSMFSRDLLIQMIRAYGSPIRSSVAGYLEQTLTLLLAANDRKPNSRPESLEEKLNLLPKERLPSTSGTSTDH